MRRLPSGTVTLFFSDIEGSTKLLHEVGQERYDELLGEHRRILREAFAAHGGHELRTEGDSFFAAFERAGDAVAAASQAQSALAGGPLRVRMGLHTGEPLRVAHEDGYVGIDVHRGARIAGTAHGGQILLSQATRELIDAELEVKDLGRHRLKDIAEPERLYQLGAASFPALKSFNQTNLPTQPTPFVGRERELEELKALLGRSDVRLLTLTGTGGSGKTRLALRAAGDLAENVADGVWLVPLAAVRDASLVLPTIAQTLGVKEPLALGEHLREKSLMLVLDNFEHLLDAAAATTALLHEAGGVQILATSRAPLRVAGEHEYPVPPLADGEAVALFVARAKAVKPSFEPDGTVAEICHRLDNLPLALELAAARVKLLSLPALLTKLDQRLSLLTGGARDVPDRQQTLRATIDWSHDLLGAEERRLFAWLSVFVGGCGLEAAESVCRADLDSLQALVDMNLLRQEEDRFDMLRTIREYGRERLRESGDEERVRRAHAEHYLESAVRAGALLAGPEELAAIESIDSELNNLRAMMRFYGDRGEFEPMVEAAGALGQFWVIRGLYDEGRGWLTPALDDSSDLPAKVRARALSAASGMAYGRGVYAESALLAEESVLLQRRLGDERALAEALNDAAVPYACLGDHERAQELYEEALAICRRVGDEWGTAHLLRNVAVGALEQAKLQQALDYLEESLVLSRSIGDELGVASSRLHLALARLDSAELETSREELRQSIATFHRAGDLMHTVGALTALAFLAARSGQPEQALRLYAAGAEACRRFGLSLDPHIEKLQTRVGEELRADLPEALLAQVAEDARLLELSDAVAQAFEPS
jgi:predicted ATPase/class 3 adenylate cyclase/Tfp pilus assembly protein PilF